jgi:hypothetical protein
MRSRQTSSSAVRKAKMLTANLSIVGPVFWEPMTMTKLRTWSSIDKTVSTKIDEKVVELKENRFLLNARMAIAARSLPELDIEDALGVHEFYSVSSTLFARWITAGVY